jgi:CRISPR system Cascade subunit CasD
MRLTGPMQAWGTQSRFDIRDTGREPSKSGVVGLVCAALGKTRDEREDPSLPSLANLARLRLGVRVDHEGKVGVDYQTAGGWNRVGEAYGVVKADGSPGDPVQSRRYYLADADFLVGLEGDQELLRRVDGALRNPVWPLYLGRRSYVPGAPVALPEQPPLGPALRPESLEIALRSYPWAHEATQLRVVMETIEHPAVERRNDVPLDFAARRFGWRYVSVRWIHKPE